MCILMKDQLSSLSSVTHTIFSSIDFYVPRLAIVVGKYSIFILNKDQADYHHGMRLLKRKLVQASAV